MNHVHHWVISTPDGSPMLPARCIAEGKCGYRRRRKFRVAPPDLLNWEERKHATWNNRRLAPPAQPTKVY